MKQHPDYIISNVAGNDVLISVGQRSLDFNSLVSLNEMGVEIWNMLANDITEDEIVSNILDEYDVPEEKAREDISAFLNVLRQNGCIDE